MKRLLLIFLVSAIFFADNFHLPAQTLEPFGKYGCFTPGVESFSMTKYGQVAPSLVTGAMHYSIPVYTISDPDFNIPISLEYNFDGYRPSQGSGAIGYGWHLNCGGVITREVRGIPDEGSYQTPYIYGWIQTKEHGITLSDDRIRSIHYINSNASDLPLGTYVSALQSYNTCSDIPVYVTEGGSKYDSAPDLFHFNFCGITGDFMITDGSGSESIKVFNSNLPHGEFKVSIDPTKIGAYGVLWLRAAEIVITTGEGTKYYFGGDMRSIEFGSDSSSASVTAFRLKKIEAPNGRVIDFVYDEVPLGWRTVTGYESNIASFYYSSLSDYVSNQNAFRRNTSSHSMGVFNFPLKEIKEGNDVLARFHYGNGGESGHYQKNDISIDALCRQPSGTIIPKHLSSIAILNHNEEIVDSLMLGHYYATSGTQKMFLSSVTSLMHGRHCFEYNLSGYTLPDNDSMSIDYWGFWNDLPDVYNIETYINLNCSSVYDQLKVSPTYKGPNEIRGACGAMTKVIYPTGGSTTISYEGNSASTLVFQGPSASEYPVGGVRVRKLINKSGEAPDAFMDSTYFYYRTSLTGTPSGVLKSMPRFGVEVNWQYSLPNNSLSIVANGYSRYFSNDCYSWVHRDSHILYKTVGTRNPDGSYTRYDFLTNGSSFGLSSPNVSTSIPKKLLTEDSFIIGSSTGGIPVPKSVDDRYWNGKPLSVMHYDPSGVLKKSVRYTYETDNHLSVQKMYFNHVTHYGSMSYSASCPVLHEVIETDYVQGDSIINRTSYWYNSYGQKASVTREGSGGAGEITDSYRYLWQTSPGAFLRSAKAVAVRTRKFEGSNYVTAKETYSYSGHNIRPTVITKYVIDVPPGVTTNLYNTPVGSDTRVSSFEYDNRFRLTHASLPGGAYLDYQWDGNNIVVKNENAPDNMTLFQWKDMVGLTSETDPSGRETKYGYDSVNRLERISDSDNHLLESYSYGLGNDVGNVHGSYIRKNVFTGLSGDNKFSDITYYDGLGYPDQELFTAWTPDGESLVHPIVYDNLRRPDAVSYLPFPGMESDTVRVTNAVQKQQQYYQTRFGESQAYSTASYDNWVDGKVLSRTRAGADWDGHSVSFQYRKGNSSDSIPRFRFIAGHDPVVKATGVLYDMLVTTTMDEDGREVQQYTDGFGRLICTRQFAGDGITKADTYYVYDMRDSLVCVLPPEGAKAFHPIAVQALDDRTPLSLAFSDSLLQTYAFLWWRDGLGRPVKSKTPGGGTVSYEYDQRDRLISYSTAAMASEGLRYRNVYDDYDRLTEQRYESSDGEVVKLRIRELQYYSFSQPGSPTPGFDFVEENGVVSSSDRENTNIKGMLRHEILRSVPGMKGNVRPDTLRRDREYHYDNRGRVIQVVESDSDGWMARYSTGYDFAGNILAYKEVHISPSNTTDSLVTRYTRDKRGNPISCQMTFNGTPLESVSYNYDDLGKLSGRDIGTDGHEEYSHDIHGWELSRSFTHGNALLFRSDIRYQQPSKPWILGDYTGRVSELSWRHGGDPLDVYALSYDELGRLSNSERFSGDSSIAVLRNTEKDLRYDLDGNLKSLKRYGPSGLEGQLSMTYSGPRLLNVSDAVDQSSFTYLHDLNGNLIYDGRRNMSYTYNILDLPDSVRLGDSLCALYTYLSDGAKVASISNHGVGYRYRGSFVYSVSSSGAEQFESVPTEVGRLVRTPPAVDHQLWYLTDHLGSTRAVIDSESGTVLERTDYLPFGTRISRGVTSNNRYTFSGKEEQLIDTTNLKLLDFGTRFYDPWLCRWNSVDPMAYKHFTSSPYLYCASDPINLVDPNGTDEYIFDLLTGNYIGKKKFDGEHYINLVGFDENGLYSESRINFADQIHDPKDIDNGIINRIIVVAEDDINKMLLTQGAFSKSSLSLAMESDRGKAYDYSYSVLKKKYSDTVHQAMAGDQIQSSALFLPAGENTAHNLMNFGNFLWGATGFTLGYPESVLLKAADINSRFNPNNGYPLQQDSPDDQISISLGVKFANKHQYRDPSRFTGFFGR